MSTNTALALFGIFFIGWFLGALCSLPDKGDTHAEATRSSAAFGILGMAIVIIVAVTRFFVLL